MIIINLNKEQIPISENIIELLKNYKAVIITDKLESFKVDNLTITQLKIIGTLNQWKLLIIDYNI